MSLVNQSDVVVDVRGILELKADLCASPFHSPDMAPTTRADRKWGARRTSPACGFPCRPASRLTCWPRR